MTYLERREIFKLKDVINKILSSLMLLSLKELYTNLEVKVREMLELVMVLISHLPSSINEFLIIKILNQKMVLKVKCIRITRLKKKAV